MFTHIVSDWLFSPCCVEHQDEFIFERVAVAYSRDYNEVGRAQIKRNDTPHHTLLYLYPTIFYPYPIQPLLYPPLPYFTPTLLYPYHTLPLSYPSPTRPYPYSEVSIIEKLPLEKNHTYLIIFLRTGQVQNNFYCTIILTYDLRFNT